MLFCTSLVAFVGAGEQPHLTPRKLSLLNTHSNAIIQNLSFPSSVLGVHLNRKRLVAVLERRAFVYDLESLQLLGTLDTPANPRGLAALTTCSEPCCLLALPALGGAVRVYDAAKSSSVDVLCELEAHKSLVSVMAWDDDGALLSTASRKGTVVRVHAVRSSEDKALEFRRGSTPATITCLAFSPSSMHSRLLCVASDHGTVHIFGLQTGRHPASKAAQSLLSTVMPRALEPQRPLATVRLPARAQAVICAVVHESQDGGSSEAGQAQTRLVVATGQGLLYSFRLDLPAPEAEQRGEGLQHSLEGEWRLLGPPAKSQPSSLTGLRGVVSEKTMARVVHAFGRALRETGLALDRAGSAMQGSYAFREELSRHRSVAPLLGEKPSLGSGVFVAPSATVIGNVTLGDKASVFYGSVIRADSGSITIGEKTNVQDGCVIRTSSAYLAGHSANTTIGSMVTIGHQASLQGCTVGDRALVGMNATLLEGSRVEDGGMVAAGAVVSPGTVVKSGEIWGGNPAVFLRKLKPEEAKFLPESAEHYARLSAEHAQETTKTLMQIAADKGLARFKALQDATKEFSHAALTEASQMAGQAARLAKPKLPRLGSRREDAQEEEDHTTDETTDSSSRDSDDDADENLGQLLQRLKQLVKTSHEPDASAITAAGEQEAAESGSSAGMRAAEPMEMLVRAVESRVRHMQASAGRLTAERDAAVRSAHAAKQEAAAANKAAQQVSNELAGLQRKLKKEIEAANKARSQSKAAADKAALAEKAVMAELAQARLELQQKQEDARLLGAAEREALQLSIEAAQADVEAARTRERAAIARAAAVADERDAAERSRQESDKLRRQAEMAASTATSVAETERQQQGEHRAKRFQAAVQAAVHKIRCELEAERDALQGRLEDAEQGAAVLRHQLQQAQTQLEMRETQLHTLTTETQNVGIAAAEARQHADSLAQQLRTATAQLAALKQAGTAAAAEAQTAHASLTAAEARLAAADVELQQLKTTHSEKKAALEAQVKLLEAQISMSNASLEAAQAEGRLMAADAEEAVMAAQKQAATAQAKVKALEGELRASSTSSQAQVQRGSRSGRLNIPSTTTEVLASLGLQGARQREEEAAMDLEMLRQLPLGGSSQRRIGGKRGGGGVAAAVSLRTWLLISLVLAINQHTHCHHTATAGGLP
ncbi:Gamma carbonic anhydrase 1 [Chlorella vulgaris]